MISISHTLRLDLVIFDQPCQLPQYKEPRGVDAIFWPTLSKTFWQKGDSKTKKSAAEKKQGGKDNGCFRQVDSHLVWFSPTKRCFSGLLTAADKRKKSTQCVLTRVDWGWHWVQNVQNIEETEIAQDIRPPSASAPLLLTNLSKIGSLTVLPYHLQVKVALIRNMDIVILKSQLNNDVKVKWAW